MAPFQADLIVSVRQLVLFYGASARPGVNDNSGGTTALGTAFGVRPPLPGVHP